MLLFLLEALFFFIKRNWDNWKISKAFLVAQSFTELWQYTPVSLIVLGTGENLKREVEITIAIIISCGFSPLPSKTFKFLIKEKLQLFRLYRQSQLNWIVIEQKSAINCIPSTPTFQMMMHFSFSFAAFVAQIMKKCAICTVLMSFISARRLKNVSRNELKEITGRCCWIERQESLNETNSSVCSISILRSNKTKICLLKESSAPNP